MAIVIGERRSQLEESSLRHMELVVEVAVVVAASSLLQVVANSLQMMAAKLVRTMVVQTMVVQTMVVRTMVASMAQPVVEPVASRLVP